jgi:hypothetical protein
MGKIVISTISFDFDREVERIMAKGIKNGVPGLKNVLVMGEVSSHVEEAGLCIQFRYVARPEEHAVKTRNFKVVVKYRPKTSLPYRVDLYPEQQRGYPHTCSHDALDNFEGAVARALDFIENQADKILKENGL